MKQTSLLLTFLSDKGRAIKICICKHVPFIILYFFFIVHHVHQAIDAFTIHFRTKY